MFYIEYIKKKHLKHEKKIVKSYSQYRAYERLLKKSKDYEFIRGGLYVV